jgi:hypothetical protein
MLSQASMQVLSSGVLLQSYTKCLSKQNQHSVHVKSIVNTEHYDRVDG